MKYDCYSKLNIVKTQILRRNVEWDRQTVKNYDMIYKPWRFEYLKMQEFIEY